jgi:cyclase
MYKRVIPVLLLDKRKIVKSYKFKQHVYIGDPLNIVKIFSDKNVDEIIMVNIERNFQFNSENISYLESVLNECFIPISYAGGITDIKQIKILNRIGFEKVVINSSALENQTLLEKAAIEFGSSTVIAGINVKKNFFNKYKVYNYSKNQYSKLEPRILCEKMMESGAGELFINNIDLDGTMAGYDTDIINELTSNLSSPVIACGGAGSLLDIQNLFTKTKVTGAAGGSMFVYHGKEKGILINYPNGEVLDKIRMIS